MFLEFFYALRDEGVPVAIQEWMMLMQALSMGQHTSSLMSFYNLARACLVKSRGSRAELAGSVPRTGRSSSPGIIRFFITWEHYEMEG